MALHEHLHKAGIKEGESFSFGLRKVTPEGITETPQTHRVEKFTGEGFFGSVILLPDSVIKTTQPEALHELLRRINWPVPFPSQTSEIAAQLDTISGEVLHMIVPALTDEAIVTPEAQGYTHLHPHLGYAQVIERMHGRTTTFRDNGKENKIIQDARERLWGLRSEIGAEHIGQIHTKNPFGKPNLWLGDKGKTIWLDYLPAFRHTGFLLPFFYYSFHRDMRQAFKSTTPTYNRIHTDILRNTLEKNKTRFSSTNRQTIVGLLELYDERWSKHAAWMNEDPRELFITDALERGIISSKDAERLRSSPLSYELFQTQQLARLGLRAFLDTVKESPLKIFWDREFLQKAAKFVLNPGYRRTQILEHTTLWGMKQAHEHGLITDEHYSKALTFIPEHELRLYVGLQLWYLLSSRLVDVITVPLVVAAATSSHPEEALGAVSAFVIFGPGIIRALSTVIAGRMNRLDLQRATYYSGIPMIGQYLAMPQQLKKSYGEQAADIEHCTLRGLVAAISKIRPGGGWGSDLEEGIWKYFSQKTKE